ncbi:hypothetical protein Vadar_012088 [Vaccinium darrowii]|uniref:Uncharacterized protein n=1 Tax=Vaccinium darrowii TaxID=229202 RepID=A0ACB7Y637_9ERIC|nr:hypothetical protein Vadar_012088 [Vaccinium darrowii]
MKQHLAWRSGEVGACKKVSADVKYEMEQSLKAISDKKKESQNKYEESNPYGPSLFPFEGDDLDDDDVVEVCGSSGNKSRALMTRKGKAKEIPKVDNYFAPRTTPGSQPYINSALATKEALHRAHMVVGKFFYDTCIPINDCNSIYFQSMFDAAISIGPGFKVPTCHQLRVPLLTDHKKELQLFIGSLRNSWKKLDVLLWVMVGKMDFSSSRYAKEKKGKEAVAIILDNNFWHECLLIVKIVEPLMRLLHIVDGDENPNIGYVYEGMYQACLGIKSMFKKKKSLHFYKQKNYDLVDIESIDKTEFWIVDEEEEPPLLDYDELEKMLQEEELPPQNKRQCRGRHDEDDANDVLEIGDDLDIGSFGQNSSTNNMHEDEDEDDDSWLEPLDHAEDTQVARVHVEGGDSIELVVGKLSWILDKSVPEVEMMDRRWLEWESLLRQFGVNPARWDVINEVEGLVVSKLRGQDDFTIDLMGQEGL